MNWNVFFAVLTWVLTTVSGISAVGMLLNESLNVAAGYRETFSRFVAIVGSVLVVIAALGAATIGGMGWAS